MDCVDVDDDVDCVEVDDDVDWVDVDDEEVDEEEDVDCVVGVEVDVVNSFCTDGRNI